MALKFDLSFQWVLSAIGFVTAFMVGLWQYRRAQRQQKVSLLLPLIAEFETDEEIQAACYLFDYDDGSFTLKGHKYKFRNADLLNAMKVVEWDLEWPPLEAAIRSALDRYFDFFGKLESFVDIHLLTFQDLKYFYYYLELLVGIDKYKGPGFAQSLSKYLGAYRLGDCQKCLDAYREMPPSLREELQLSQEDSPR
jgi:hypothetical protein